MSKNTTTTRGQGWRMEIPSWNGRAENIEEYAGSVELLVLGTKKDDRVFLGPQLVAALPPGSSQRKLAMRLPRDAEDGDSIASETGTENLVRAFRASLGTQIVNDVGEKTDQYFYGGTGRGPLSRKTGQSMSQWIEAEEDAYHEMLKSYKVICPDLKDILPSEVRGVLLWRNSGLSASERSTISTALNGQWAMTQVIRRLKASWTDKDLNLRDRSAKT